MPMNRREKVKKLKIAIAIEAVVVVALTVAFVITFFNHKINQINHEDIEPEDIYVADIETKGYRNIALFGVDARSVKETSVRSDTIMIVSINEDTSEVQIVSVYRDTYVYVENYGSNNSTTSDDYTKITHAYAHGGPALAVSTLNENFDLNITEYATVNFYVLADIVDALGGLEITVETDAMVKSINRYGKEVADGEKETFTNVTATGTQILDGFQVLGYARTRKIDSDFKRAERQREVLTKIFGKIKTSNLSTLNKVYDEVAANVLTSLDSSEIVELMPDAAKYSITNNEGFPYNNYAATLNGSSDVFSRNMIDDIVTMHTKLYPDQEYEPSDRVRSICQYVSDIQPVEGSN